MVLNELTNLSIEELGELIKTRKVSPVDITKAYLKNIKKWDSEINSYITVLEEESLEQAKNSEALIADGKYKGLLHGIPLAIKDNINLSGIPTTSGSIINKDYVAKEHAPVVKQMLNAGMIPIGKTNLHEFAMGVTTDNPHYEPTKNPWSLDRVPGGSSGGSAAALAANLAPASLGTDTAGSIRIPSACCGTVGLKPTFGTVSKEGVFPLSWSLDHVGPMTRTVKDTALMFQAMSNSQNVDENFIEQTMVKEDLRGKTITIPDIVYEQTDSNVLNKLEAMTRKLKKLGAEVNKVTLNNWKYVEYATFITIWVEAATIHKEKLKRHAAAYGKDVSVQLKLGQVLSGVQYMQAQQLRRKIKDELNNILQSSDAIMLPTIPVSAPTIGEDVVNIEGEEHEVIPTLLRFTSIGNISGLPALAIPSGVSNDNLPVGIQLIGKAFDEESLLHIGHQLEQEALPLKERQPSFLDQL